MGQGRALGPDAGRRAVLARATAAAAAALVGCTPDAAAPIPAAWVGASFDRGHRLRSAQQLPPPALRRRAGAIVVGAGIAGLAAARALAAAGVDDVQVLELEDSAGGNARGHAMGGMGCPLGAHYLPLPGPESIEVAAWLHELGLLRSELGRTVADERHLCHSLQERLLVDGAWVEGLLPPVDARGAAQMRQFSARVAALGRGRRFALPAHRGAWDDELEALNRITFAQWLDAAGLDDARLRWYLDYCCRDDYGAGSATVSAWAGIHYFASRHGFRAPGEAGSDSEGLLTWPEGNAWLARRLAAPLGERLHPARTVLRVTEGRHDVEVLAWDEANSQLEAWTAPRAVLALPLFIAARIVESPPQPLRDAAALLAYAPWLVANLQLDSPPLERSGAPPAWDNVIYGRAGLGYVDAMHQSLLPRRGATVFTAYLALERSERPALLAADPAPWAERALREVELAHPEIRRHLRRIDLMRWGHAMAIPLPGVHRHPALQALRAARGRLRYAHADLAGYSVFEEAFTAGCEAAA
ncbi:MAG: FAD-dependent oxidoreductase [Burkholderiales bacterium]|nr:FAD-dependent oxidoreductase [Burkholderiales bacterium]